MVFAASPDHTDPVPLCQLIQVELSVLAPGATAVGEDAAAGHHHGAGLGIGHGGGEVEHGGVVRGDAHLDAAGPFVHQAVDAELKQFAVARGSTWKDEKYFLPLVLFEKLIEVRTRSFSPRLTLAVLIIACLVASFS